MERLMEYTGGNILFTFGSAVLVLFGIILTIINIFVAMKKNQGMNKARKIECVVNTISLVVLSIFLGAVVGYYMGILKFL